jgi:prephenate dehydrogenase
MSSNHKDDGVRVGASIQSVLICGCGLIGTSLAMAWKRANLPMRVYGVDPAPHHREEAMGTGAFVRVFASIPADKYDLIVLATPIDIACTQMASVDAQATWIMDVCSVKKPLLEVAASLGRRNTFAPTHPMAGVAAEGPANASATMFAGHPWICLEGWPAAAVIQPLIRATGARVVFIDSAERHDAVMAACSHSVHLVSLTTMLMFDALATGTSSLAQFTGPGFRDVSRLSASPSGFWVSTLMANRENIIHALDVYTQQLQGFLAALQSGDEDSLRSLLDHARAARTQWEEEQSCL